MPTMTTATTVSPPAAFSTKAPFINAASDRSALRKEAAKVAATAAN